MQPTNEHWAALWSEITLNRWKDSTTKIPLSSVDNQTNILFVNIRLNWIISESDAGNHTRSVYLSLIILDSYSNTISFQWSNSTFLRYLFLSDFIELVTEAWAQLLNCQL